MINVLMIYPDLVPSALLCGWFQLKWMAERNYIYFRASSSGKLTSELFSWADIIFLVRCDSRYEEQLAMRWKAAGKYLIYVLDDDLLHVPGFCSSAAHYGEVETKNSIRHIMRECDCLLSPSPKLREMYGAEFSKVLSVDEPSIQQVFTRTGKLQPVRIGFAGSVDRAGDIDLLLGGCIRQLLQKYGDRISIEFFGARPEAVVENNLKWLPYCDSYETYQEKLRTLNWEIGLAPMPDTPFHACKYFNKFIEYASCGIVGVYSDVPPYRGNIENDKTGLLCANTTDEWVRSISLLIDRPELRFDMANRCVKVARKRFSVAATAQALRTEMGDLLSLETSHTLVSITDIRTKYNLERLRRGFRKYGLRLPAVAARKAINKLYWKNERAR